MGAVALQERATGLVDRGYPVCEATLYIYCDACGSFNIKVYIPILRLLGAAAVLAAGAALLSAYRQWLVCLIPLCLLALYLPWKDMFLKYKCRKCGNARISDYNSLHYQAYDLSVVDVPDRQAQKRYLDTDVLHFGQFT